MPVVLLAVLLSGCGTTALAGRDVPGRPAPSGATGADGGRHQPGWPPPAEMHTRTSPRAPHSNRAATYGLGDLDGDGRADLVEVRTDGRVTAELTWLGHRAARLPADPTLRLQALPDLDGDGRAEVLVASTAAGCCDAYRLPDTRSAVLAVVHGRLRPLRWADDGQVRLRFDQGRGDLYAGIRCGPDGLHLLEALDDGSAATLTDAVVSILAGVARHGPVTRRTVAAGRVRSETSTRCPGLDAQGWAA